MLADVGFLISWGKVSACLERCWPGNGLKAKRALLAAGKGEAAVDTEALLASVVVPVHNSGEWVDDCVRSLFAQSFEDWGCGRNPGGRGFPR